VKKKYKWEFNKYPIRSKKKFNQEESIRSINRNNSSEFFNTIPHNNAPPIEVSSTDVRSSIRRGETILMVWHCFFSLIRNVFSNLTNQFSKRSKQSFSDGFESEKEYHTSREVRIRIFWKKLFIKWKSLIRGILFGGGKRGYQPYDWETWISDLVVEVFVVGKPDNPKHLSTKGERSSLENIGTVFITLQLHWSNGYCISTSSSDDG
jgi:hypothetical protein